MVSWEAVETVDGRWMILVNGFQWGPDASRVDKSGANDATWKTEEEAQEALETSYAIPPERRDA